MRSLPVVLAVGVVLAGCHCNTPPPPGSGGDGGDGGTKDGGKVGDGGPGTQCVPTSSACNPTADTCCSGVCNGDADGGAPFCHTPTFCKGPGVGCAAGTECCTNSCVGGVCSSTLCLAQGQACTSGSQCCSTLCATTCQPVPGATCKTLGETCNTGTDCCSTNCQGGVCVRAFGCQANGDLCLKDADCCGHACSKNDGTPGTCLVVTGGGGGGCLQDGNPCAGGTTCCSRICLDLGTGVKVCQVAGGCRLTGDWCTAAQECCGGGTNPNGSVNCDNGRCDNGQACNPVGNICGRQTLSCGFRAGGDGGGGVNASENCCDGKKEVCKCDSAGIPRCFGGGSASCPNGYDPTDPNCCIAQGSPCQFSDQCCGGIPCVPPGDGGAGLFCDKPSCQPIGTTCTPGQDAGPSSCCAGTQCLPVVEVNQYACQYPQAAGDGGATSGDGGTTGGDGGGGPTCKANGATCSAGTDCCSAICTGGICQAPSTCQPQGGTCTTPADCCAGLACNINPGSSTGTCGAGSTCNAAGQACTPNSNCCSGLACYDDSNGGVCNGTHACHCKIFG